MMRKMEVFNLISPKHDFMPARRLSTDNSKGIFSEILSSERKNLSQAGENRWKNSLYNYHNQNKTSSYEHRIQGKNTIQGENVKNKPVNKQVTTTDTNKTASSKTTSSKRQLKKHKDINNDNIDEIVENLDEDLLEEEAMAGLYSILAGILENILNLENMTEDELAEMGPGYLEELTSLKEGLLSSLGSLNISQDQDLMEELRTLVEYLENIDLGALLNGNELGNLKGFREKIQTIIDRFSPNDPNLQNINFRDQAINLEEEDILKDQEYLEDPGTIVVRSDLKNIDSFDPSNEEEGFLDGFKNSKETVLEEQLVIQQNTSNNENIYLNIAKNQVLEPKRFINQIAHKINTFILKGKNEMDIKLMPENLGKLSIKIGLNEGSLTGRIYAENYSVKQAIEANLNQLRDSLEEQGLNIAGLEVHIRDNSQNFERNLGQYNHGQRQNVGIKTGSIKVVDGSTGLENRLEEVNPYLSMSQFEGLV